MGNGIQHSIGALWTKIWLGLLSLIFAAAVTLPSATAQAEPMREFVMSCSYGVLAGTLVGAATLAFTDRPGDNLNKVARGASLGLYAGILLGFYVAYGIPAEEEDTSLPTKVQIDPPRLQVYPLISERGFEGAAAQLRVLSF